MPPSIRAALAALLALASVSPAGAVSSEPIAPLTAPPSPPNAAPPAPPSAELEEVPPVRAVSSWRSSTNPPLARVAEANASKRELVKGLFAAAGVSFPPSELLLRGFKKERRLEMWASSRLGAALLHVTTYEICSASGELGPKRKQGDRQVPEGFYTLTEYHPASRYYLAMLVSYPNTSDRILGDKVDPGNEIMIHGRCASVGCLAMSDERIQEIWIAATALRSAGGVVHVHVFPARDMAGLLAKDDHPEHRAFWGNLKEGLDLFDAKHRLPFVRVDASGRYRFR